MCTNDYFFKLEPKKNSVVQNFSAFQKRLKVIIKADNFALNFSFHKEVYRHVKGCEFYRKTYFFEHMLVNFYPNFMSLLHICSVFIVL